MLQGKISATRIAEQAGYLRREDAEKSIGEYHEALAQLGRGMFAVENKGRMDIHTTDEGYELSKSLLTKGYIATEELKAFPSASAQIKGVHPVIECTQNIPCNPCQDACMFGYIRVGGDIIRIPEIDMEKKCSGCGMCVASCSGQAIFLVNKDYEPGYASVGIPYEFLPLPEKGAAGKALDRSGNPVCDARVISVKTAPAMDKTALLLMKVPVEYADEARFFKA